MEDPKQINTDEEELVEPPINKSNSQIQVLLSNKLAKKNSERFTYLIATIMSSFGVTSMAIFDVYYKFSWQMEVHIYTSSFNSHRVCQNHSVSAPTILAKTTIGRFH